MKDNSKQVTGIAKRKRGIGRVFAWVAGAVAVVAVGVSVFFVSLANRNNYTVSYKVNDEQVDTKFNGSITIGELKEPKKKGYIFNGWYADENFTEPLKADHVLKGNATIYPLFYAREYSVNYFANNGTNDTVINSVNFDAKFTTLANPFTREGYEFVGWSTNPNAVSPSEIVNESTDVSLKTENVSYYAIWRGKVVQVAYNLAELRVNGEQVQLNNVNSRFGDVITLPEFSNVTKYQDDNAALVGYNVNGKIYAAGSKVVVESEVNSLVITPVWGSKDASKLYVTVVNPETGVEEQLIFNGHVTGGNYSYYLNMDTDAEHNQTLTEYIEAMGLRYYDFKDIVFGAGVENAAEGINQTVITSSNSVFGKLIFEGKERVVKLYDDTELVATLNVKYGDKINLNEVQRDNRSFMGYSRAGYNGRTAEYVGSIYCLFEDTQTNLYVNWRMLTVNFNANGGVGYLGNYNLKPYETYTLTQEEIAYQRSVVTKDSNILIGWSTDPNATTGSFTINLEAGHKTLYAVWKHIQATVVYTRSSDEETIPNSFEIDIKTNLTLSTVGFSYPGHLLVGFLCNGEFYNTNERYLVTGDVTIKAVWQEVRLSFVGGGDIAAVELVDGGMKAVEEVTVGTTFYAPNVADEDSVIVDGEDVYYFVGWSEEEGATVPTQFYNESVITYSGGNSVYYAVYAPMTMDLTFAEYNYDPNLVNPAPISHSNPVTEEQGWAIVLNESPNIQPQNGILVIPSYYNGHKVTAVLGNRDANAEPVRNVVNSTTTHLIISPGIEVIDNCAFCYSAIKTVTIPESVKYIGPSCFAYCENLETVFLPSAIEEVDSTAFVGSDNTTLKTKAVETVDYMLVDGIIYNSDMTTLISCSKGKSGSVVIPETVTTIIEEAFYACNKITNVTIPSSVTRIGDRAFKDCKSLSYVSISSGVKKVSEETFSGCRSLVSITFEEGVLEEIEDKAFYGCELLSQVQFPSTLKTIGANAFYGCSNLTTIALNDGLEEIGEGAFVGSNIASVTVPASLAFNKNAFMAEENIDVLTEELTIAQTERLLSSKVRALIFKEGVLEIGEGALEGWGTLTSVVLPNSLTSIGANAFKNCFNVQEIELGAGLATIGANAFEKCVRLGEIVLPDSVTELGGEAFLNCKGLEVVVLGKGVEVLKAGTFAGCTGLNELTIPEDSALEEVEGNVFTGCELNELVLPNSVTTIATEAFANLEVKRIVLGNGIDTIQTGLFTDKATLESVTLGNGVLTIQERAFANTGLKAIVIPDSVMLIGERAFEGATELKTVNVGKGVYEIGARAFEGCTGLETLTFAEGVRREASEFRGYHFGAVSLIEIMQLVYNEYGLRGTAIGEDEFVAENLQALAGTLEDLAVYEGLTDDELREELGLYLFDEVTDEKIALVKRLMTYDAEELQAEEVDLELAKAFVKDYTQLQLYLYPGVAGLDFVDGEVDLSNYIDNELTGGRLYRIGEYAFHGCTSLVNLDIPDTVEYILPSAFEGCTSLKTVLLGSGLFEIRESAFKGSTALEVLDFDAESRVAVIESNAFEGCIKLKALTIPDSVVVIGESAFSGCTGLAALTLGENVQFIFNHAFYGCSKLEKVTILTENDAETGAVTAELCNLGYIGEYAFAECNSLAAIRLPRSLGALGYRAFYNDRGLFTAIVNSESLDFGDEAFFNCTHLYFVFDLQGYGFTVGSTEYGYVAYYAKSISEETTEEIQEILVADNGYFYSDITPEGETTKQYKLLGYLYNDLKEIKAEDLWENTVEVGESAFANYYYLTTVEIPDSVKVIDRYAFSYCTNLVKITLGAGLEEIEGGAFNHCGTILTIYNYSELELEAGSVENGGIAKNAIEILTPVGGVMPLGNQIEVISGLKYYKNGDEWILVGKIDESITEIDSIDTRAVAISNGVFYGTNVTKVVIPATIKSIGYDAFAYCAALAELTFEADELDNAEELVIGEGAFAYTNSLKEVVLPDTLKEIPELMFAMSGLEKVTYGNAVETIGDMAFRGVGLHEIVVPDTVVHVGEEAFYAEAIVRGIEEGEAGEEETEEKELVVGAGVESIGARAFAGHAFTKVTVECEEFVGEEILTCDTIEEVVIGDGVKVIGAGMFADNYNLHTLTFGENPSLEAIEDEAFFNTDIYTLVIPASVKFVGNDAFSTDKNIVYVYFDAETGDPYNDDTNEPIPYNFDDELGYVFTDTSVTYVRSDEDHPVLQYAQADGIERTLTINAGAPKDKVLRAYEIQTILDEGNNLSDDELNDLRDEMQEIMQTYMVQFGEYVFAGTQYNKVTLNGAYVNFGHNAFAYNNYISEVEIGSEVVIIQEDLFANLPNLHTLTFAENSSIKYIMNRAFYGTDIYELVLPDSLEIIGDKAFAHEESVYVGSNEEFTRELTIGEGVKFIGGFAFKGSAFTKVTLLAEDAQYGKPAFEDCVRLTTVEIGDSVLRIDDYAFNGCTNVHYLTFGENPRIEEIGERAFYNTDIYDLVIPASIQYVGHEAFARDEVIRAKEVVRVYTDRTTHKFIDAETGNIVGDNNSYMYEDPPMDGSDKIFYNNTVTYVDHIYGDVLQGNLPDGYYAKIMVRDVYISYNYPETLDPPTITYSEEYVSGAQEYGYIDTLTNQIIVSRSTQTEEAGPIQWRFPDRNAVYVDADTNEVLQGDMAAYEAWEAAKAAAEQEQSEQIVRTLTINAGALGEYVLGAIDEMNDLMAEINAIDQDAISNLPNINKVKFAYFYHDDNEGRYIVVDSADVTDTYPLYYGYIDANAYEHDNWVNVVMYQPRYQLPEAPSPVLNNAPAGVPDFNDDSWNWNWGKEGVFIDADTGDVLYGEITSEQLDLYDHLNELDARYEDLMDFIDDEVVMIRSRAFANSLFSKITLNGGFVMFGNLGDRDFGNYINGDFSNHTFAGCYNVKEVEIGKDVVAISPFAFAGLEINTLTFEENSSLAYIMMGAFLMSDVHELIIPDSVEYIGMLAFARGFNQEILGMYEQFMSNQDGLDQPAPVANNEPMGTLNPDADDIERTLVISNGVRTIGIEAFACSLFNKVTINANIDPFGTDLQNLGNNNNMMAMMVGEVGFGLGAFADMQNLTEVILGNNVEVVGPGAFAFDYNLHTLTFGDEPSLRIIDKGAFMMTDIYDLVIPSSVELIDVGAFANNFNNNIYDLYPGEQFPGYLSEYNVGGKDELNPGEELPAPVVQNGAQEAQEYIQNVLRDGRERTLTINGENTVIADQAFFMSAFSNVNISGVQNIAFGAFGAMYNLEEVVIGEGVQEIGPGAFFDCEFLTKVTIGPDVEIIRYGAFGDCFRLHKVTFVDEGNLLIIGMGAFVNTMIYYDLTIPGSVELIGEGAFAYADRFFDYAMGLNQFGFEKPELNEFDFGVTIPAKRVLKIGSNGTANLRFLGQGAFHNNLFTKVELYSKLGRMVAYGDVDNQDDIRNNIGEYAFAQSIYLTDAVIGGDIGEIAPSMFTGCENLKNLTFNTTDVKQDNYGEVELDEQSYVPGVYYTRSRGAAEYVLATGEYDPDATYYARLYALRLPEQGFVPGLYYVNDGSGLYYLADEYDPSAEYFISDSFIFKPIELTEEEFNNSHYDLLWVRNGENFEYLGDMRDPQFDPNAMYFTLIGVETEDQEQEDPNYQPVDVNSPEYVYNNRNNLYIRTTNNDYNGTTNYDPNETYYVHNNNPEFTAVDGTVTPDDLLNGEYYVLTDHDPFQEAPVVQNQYSSEDAFVNPNDAHSWFVRVGFTNYDPSATFYTSNEWTRVDVTAEDFIDDGMWEMTGTVDDYRYFTRNQSHNYICLGENWVINSVPSLYMEGLTYYLWTEPGYVVANYVTENNFDNYRYDLYIKDYSYSYAPASWNGGYIEGQTYYLRNDDAEYTLVDHPLTPYEYARGEYYYEWTPKSPVVQNNYDMYEGYDRYNPNSTYYKSDNAWIKITNLTRAEYEAEDAPTYYVRVNNNGYYRLNWNKNFYFDARETYFVYQNGGNGGEYIQPEEPAAPVKNVPSIGGNDPYTTITSYNVVDLTEERFEVNVYYILQNNRYILATEFDENQTYYIKNVVTLYLFDILDNIDFGGLNYIGESAFQYTALKNVTIPDSVQRIGNNAFANFVGEKEDVDKFDSVYVLADALSEQDFMAGEYYVRGEKVDGVDTYELAYEYDARIAYFVRYDKVVVTKDTFIQKLYYINDGGNFVFADHYDENETYYAVSTTVRYQAISFKEALSLAQTDQMSGNITNVFVKVGEKFVSMNDYVGSENFNGFDENATYYELKDYLGYVDVNDFVVDRTMIETLFESNKDSLYVKVPLDMVAPTNMFHYNAEGTYYAFNDDESTYTYSSVGTLSHTQFMGGIMSAQQNGYPLYFVEETELLKPSPIIMNAPGDKYYRPAELSDWTEDAIFFTCDNMFVVAEDISEDDFYQKPQEEEEGRAPVRNGGNEYVSKLHLEVYLPVCDVYGFDVEYNPTENYYFFIGAYSIDYVEITNEFANQILSRGGDFVFINQDNNYLATINYDEEQTYYLPLFAWVEDYFDGKYIFNHDQNNYGEQEEAGGLILDTSFMLNYVLDSSKLRTLTLGEGLREVESYAFGNTVFEKIIINSQNAYFQRGAFGNDGDGSDVVELEIGDEVRTIESDGNLFSPFYNLEKVYIGKNLKQIDDSMFYGCGSLTKLVFADDATLEYIGREAFRNTAIKDVIIPNSVKTIGEFAFADYMSRNGIYNHDENTNGDYRHLVVGESVTEVGQCAFGGRQVEFNSITLLNDLAAFPESYNFPMFANNENICEVTIGGKAECIPYRMFLNSTNITSLTLNDGVKRIENEAFRYTNLTSLVIPDSVEYIGNRAFANAGQHVEWEAPVLHNAPNDEEELDIHGDGVLYIGSGVTFIDDYAFSENNFTTVILVGAKGLGIEWKEPQYEWAPVIKNATVNSNYNPEWYFGTNAFDNSNNLTTVYISSNVVRIPDNTFNNCSNLHYVEFESVDVSDYEVFNPVNLTEEEFNQGVYYKLLGDNDKFEVASEFDSRTTYYAKFYVVNNLTREEFEAGTFYTKEYHFEYPGYIEYVQATNYVAGQTYYLRSSDADEAGRYIAVPGLTEEEYNNGLYFTKSVRDEYELTDEIVLGEVYTLDGYKEVEVTQFEFNNGIYYLCESDFQESPVVSNVPGDFGPSGGVYYRATTYSEYYRYYQPEYSLVTSYSQLPEHHIDLYKKIEKEVYCSEYYEYVIQKSPLIQNEIARQPFDPNKTYYRYSDSYFVYYAGLREIGQYAFARTSIFNLTIPDSVERIGDWSFGNYTFEPNQDDIEPEVRELVIGSGVKYIGTCAFAESGFTKVILNGAYGLGNSGNYPEQLYAPVINNEYVYGEESWYIGTQIFSGSEYLTDVVISENVVSISDWAFYNCRNLINITIPNSVTYIDDGAFSGCESLTNITIPESVTRIGDYAFYNTSLKDVVIPDSVTEIGKCAFAEYVGDPDVERTLVLGASLGQISTNFGSRKNTNTWTWKYEHSFYKAGNFTKVVIRNSNLDLVKQIFNYTNSNMTKPAWLTQAKGYLPQITAITEIEINGNATSIPNNIFEGATNLHYLTLGDGVGSIGERAFYGASLYELTIPDSVEYIGIEAFANSNLDGYGHFDDNTNEFVFNEDVLEQRELIIGDGVRYIGDDAFRQSAFTKVTLNGAQGLGKNEDDFVFGSYVFAYAQYLTEVEISNNVVAIPLGTFYNASNLHNVTIGENVEVIGDYAFTNASIYNLVIPDSVKEIGSFAFAMGDSSIKRVIYVQIEVDAETGDARLVDADSGLGIEYADVDLDEYYDGHRPDINSINSDKVYLDVTYYDDEDYVEPSEPDDVHNDDLGTLTLGASLETVNYNAFAGSLYSKLIMSSKDTVFSYDAFRGNRQLTKVVASSLEDWMSYEYRDMYSTPLGIGEYGQRLFVLENGTEKEVTELSFTEPTILKNYAFAGCNSLETVRGIEYISGGSYLFLGCDIDRVTVYDLDAYTFGSNYAASTHAPLWYAKHLFIEGNVQEVITLNLPLLAYDADNKTIGDYRFANFVGLKRIVFPSYPDEPEYQGIASNPQVAKYMLTSHTFYNCTGLNEVVVGTSVIESSFPGGEPVGANTFDRCVNLTTVFNYTDLHFVQGSRTFGCIAEHAIIRNSSSEGVGTTYTERVFNSLRYLQIVENGTPTEEYILMGFEEGANTNIDVDQVLGSDVGVIGTTLIGKNAFAGTSIKSLIIPASVTKIEESAFEGCVYLKTVVFEGNSNIDIGANAFKGCTSLTSVTLPASQKSIPDNMFSGCTSLTTINLPTTLESIGKNAFSGCSKLTSVNLGELTYLHTIGEYAFANNDLREVVIGDTVNEVPQYAFYNNKNLRYVKVGNKVTSIASNAFANCYSLVAVTLGTKVNSIADNAFANDYQLVLVNNLSLVANDDVKAIVSNWRSVISEPTFTLASRINDYTISGTRINVFTEDDDTLTVIGTYEYVAITSLDFSVNTELNNNVKTIAKWAFGKYNNIGQTGLATLVLPANLEVIEDYAFYHCRAMTTLIIPDSVKTIGDYAFDGYYYSNPSNTNYLSSYYSNVRTLVIGSGVESIGTRAFYNFRYLTTLTFNAGTEDLEIGDSAFAYCTNIQAITIPDRTVSIGNSAFYYCTSLKTLTIGSGVELLGSSAFYYCYSLNSLTFVDDAENSNESQLTRIGSYAFYYCYNLAGTLAIPNKVTEIGDYAFYAYSTNTKLTNLILGNSVQKIGLYAFTNYRNIMGLVIPASVTNIYSYAFSGCYALTEIWNWSNLNIVANSTDNGYVAKYAAVVYNHQDIESRLTTINGLIYWKLTDEMAAEFNMEEAYVLAYKESATKVVNIDSRTVGIKQYAFYNCGDITSISFPYNAVTQEYLNSVRYIGEYAFYYAKNSSVEMSIILPISIEEIGQYAFANMQRLTLYAEAGEKPAGWVSTWANGAKVYWYSETLIGDGIHWRYGRSPVVA